MFPISVLHILSSIETPAVKLFIHVHWYPKSPKALLVVDKTSRQKGMGRKISMDMRPQPVGGCGVTFEI